MIEHHEKLAVGKILVASGSAATAAYGPLEWVQMGAGLFAIIFSFLQIWLLFRRNGPNPFNWGKK